MASVASSLQHIKDNPLDYVDKALVENACHEHDYNWRVRELDPATTISLFMQQVVGGNISCAEVRHLGGDSFSAQAYCGARARIPHCSMMPGRRGKKIDAAFPGRQGYYMIENIS